MHEYAIVQQLVDEILEDLRRREVRSVRQVHLRRGSTFSEGSLRQAYEILTANTPLAGAELIVEEFGVDHTCPRCGATQRIGADDLLGHLFICLQCGAASDVDEAHGLQIVAVRTEGSP